MIVGSFCPVILKTHENTHPFLIDTLWRRFWLLTAPLWLLGLQYVTGFLQPSVATIQFDDQTLQSLRAINPWLPASGGDGSNWLVALGFASVYLAALNLFIIPKSLAYFERILPKLCLLASLVGIFGLLQKAAGLQQPLLTHGTGSSDFFAIFPYEGHWAAFATLWCAACVAMALLSTRYEDSGDFVDSTGPWYLCGATILGASGFTLSARWPASILLLSYAALLLLVAISLMSRQRDKHRIQIATGCGLLGIAAFSSAINRIFEYTPTNQTFANLRQAAYEMFCDRILWGSGLESFQQLIPFYADDLILTDRHQRAASDVLQSLAELGLLGSLLFPAIIVYLLIRYIRLKRNVLLTNQMLIGCAGVLALSLVDSPFMSPTVFLSFFIVFFSALRWADLSRVDVDAVDALNRPQLVTPESKRQVPFFTGKHNEKEK